MFNKNLLLSGSQKKLDGIWEITVGSSFSSYYGKTTNSNSDPKSGIATKLDPQDYIVGSNGESFLANNLLMLRSYYGKGIYYDEMSFHGGHTPNLAETTLFVHVKKDSGIVTQDFYFDLNRGSCQNHAIKLFSSSDVGKTYRMYIGPLDTPPRGSKPLFLKQLFNLLEGCLDVQQESDSHQQRFNNRCHYYQRVRSGWCNRIRQILRASFAGGNQDHQTSDWGRDYGIVSGLCNFGRVIYLGSLRQHFLEHYKKLSNRLSNGRNVSAIRRFVLSVFASHTMGGAYA